VGLADAVDERTAAGLPPAIRSRIVRRLLLAAGCPAEALTADHIRRVTTLLGGSPAQNRAEIALPGGRTARQEGAYLRVRV